MNRQEIIQTLSTRRAGDDKIYWDLVHAITVVQILIKRYVEKECLEKDVEEEIKKILMLCDVQSEYNKALKSLEKAREYLEKIIIKI